MNFFRRFFVYGLTVAAILSSSISVFAENHVMKTAFLGNPNLKSIVVGKMFDETHILCENDDVCGIRLTSPKDSVLYEFRDVALSMAHLEDAALPECNIIFMIADLSAEGMNLDDVLVRDFNRIRISSGGKKVLLIAMNSGALSRSVLEKINGACKFYGKDSFNYILTSPDEDNETFRNRLFKLIDKIIDWKALPSLARNNPKITRRLNLIRIMMSRFDKNALRALVAEVILQDNDRSVLEQRTTTLEQSMSAVKEDIRDLKLTVEELRHIRDEQGRLNEFAQSLRELGTLIHNISTEGAPNDEESQRILERVSTIMRSFDITEESDSTDERAPDDEMNKLKRHMAEMKRRIAENIEDINDLKRHAKRVNDGMGTMQSLNDRLVADRERWEARAVEIKTIADSLRRTEDQMKQIAESAEKDFIAEQYQKSGWFARLRLRTLFPYIDELAKQHSISWTRQLFPCFYDGGNELK